MPSTPTPIHELADPKTQARALASAALSRSMANPFTSATLFNAGLDFESVVRGAASASGMELLSVDLAPLAGPFVRFAPAAMDQLHQRIFDTPQALMQAVKLAMKTSGSPLLLAVSGAEQASPEAVKALAEMIDVARLHGVHAVIDAPDIGAAPPDIRARAQFFDMAPAPVPELGAKLAARRESTAPPPAGTGIKPA